MKYSPSILLFIVLLFSSNTYSKTGGKIDDVYYSAKPVSMIASVKKDSYIYFPNPVRLKDDFLNYAEVVVTNDVVVFNAIREFDSRKFVFQDLKTEKIYIFNISANTSSDPRHVRLLLPDTNEDGERSVKSKGNAYVSLTQHASMSLYYPLRYAPVSKSIREVRVKEGNANYFISFNGIANPIKAWKGFGYFVTAVKITNLESKKIEIDPRIHFRGDWVFLTPQHSWLASHADRQKNITTVYVISKRPFWESLL
ncbi:DUF3438 family protein [Aliikangiella maris]|uniref:DUF3438 family protein n=2 Tax=Aliikangiella maris TaxID=3162458 RepID=A0ABV3MTT1_9GAMM